ncbi:hypothetical protein S101258_01761 [Lactiplantibacillus plantarum subsp. plantarum]|uniref:Uncharacterized protein n=1 Tax=Lactiplantibacillus plantarum subsp. plantarum TaxID=337330 RepID=A0A2S3U650_LACPN|nr:hypothetical protein S101258_01761 [Lactiplantibacillus plantarum subsp. plantarum]
MIDTNRFGVYSPDVFTSAAPDMMSFDEAQSKKLLRQEQERVEATSYKPKYSADGVPKWR